MSDGQAALPRRDRGGDAPAGRGRRAGRSAATEPVGGGGPGDDLHEVFEQGAGAPLRQRRGGGQRPGAVPGGGADPGAARGGGGAHLEVGEAEAGTGGAPGRGAAGAGVVGRAVGQPGGGPQRRRRKAQDGGEGSGQGEEGPRLPG